MKFVNIGDHLLSILSKRYDKEEKASRAYDLVALKYWGTSFFLSLGIFFHLD